MPIPQRRAEFKHRQGYLRVPVYVEKYRNVHVLAHRIVWRYFHGPIGADMDINHKNGLKNDNRPENLEVVTRSANLKHSYRVLQSHKIAGDHHPYRKLSSVDVIEIRRLHATGTSLANCGRIYQVTPECIGAIVKRRTWRCVP